MPTIVVRYQPTAEHADENQQLVEAVFAELAADQPDGIRYATWRLADNTFIHIADISTEPNPLVANVAFQRFQTGIQERCQPDTAPNAQSATLIGNHSLLH
jgi:hypothetical protein